jgi:hypothetical protein
VVVALINDRPQVKKVTAWREFSKNGIFSTRRHTHEKGEKLKTDANNPTPSQAVMTP